VLSTNVVVNSFCNINEAVLLPQVTIGASCRLRKVVIDRGCTIPDGTVIGEDPTRDAERFYRTESGVVLVTAEALKRLAAQAG
jgi:glucose-1-phosphate adenylyltransferase